MVGQPLQIGAAFCRGAAESSGSSPSSNKGGGFEYLHAVLVHPYGAVPKQHAFTDQELIQHIPITAEQVGTGIMSLH